MEDIIIKKMIRDGKQSAYDIINEITVQNPNKNPKSVERSVRRKFVKLQLEDGDGKKKIALEYSVEIHENTRYYFNLTDDGIDSYIEKWGLSSEDFWNISINLFKKDYRFRFGYTDDQSDRIKDEQYNRIKYNYSDNPSRLEKWSFETLYEEYKTQHKISERIFNPFGTVKTFNTIKDLLHKYFDYRGDVSGGFDYDQWCELYPILDAYVHKDSSKIKKVWRQVESGELDQIGNNINKNEMLSQLKRDEVLCTVRNYDKKENGITPIGVLFYLVLMNFYHPEKNIDDVQQYIREFLPLIFDKPIWTELTKLKSSKEIHSILIKPFIEGFVEIFQESFADSDMVHLNYLYYYEQRIYYKIKQLFEIGHRILEKHSEQNCSIRELNGYLNGKKVLPESLVPYKRTYSKLGYLYFVFKEKRDNDENIFDHNIDSKKLIIEPILEFITFHFYTYLKSKLEQKEWEEFLKEQGNVKKFWDEWHESIPQIN